MQAITLLFAMSVLLMGCATTGPVATRTHFKTLEAEEAYIVLYDQLLTEFPSDRAEHNLQSQFGTTYVLEFGDAEKPPLVLLHWFSFNSTVWLPIVDDLAQNYRVYCVDIIGDMGKSNATSPPKTEYELAQWLKITFDQLELDQVHLVGYSNGGFSAAIFALYYSERISQLTLLAPAATVDKFSFTFFKTVIGTALLPSQRAIKKFISTFSTRPANWREEHIDMLTRAFHKTKVQVKLYPRKFSDEELAKLPKNTHIILGENENIYSVDRAIKNIYAHMNNPVVTIIPDAGHAVVFDQPDKLKALLINK